MPNKKILLVEDESIEALDIKRTLESFGYEVPYIASSSEEAVDKALEIMPNLILMDIILKGESNGIDAASKIKELNIPIIYLTAHSEEATIERAKLTEPYGYIIKPYDPLELKYSIELAIYKNKMEKQLVKSEKSYRQLAENIPGIVYRVLLTKNMQMQFFNQMVYDMTGFTPKELVKGEVCSIDPLIIPEDRERVLKTVKCSILSKKDFLVDYRIQHKDGSIKYFRERGKPIYDDDGKPLYIDGVIFDVTSIKESELKIKDANKKWENTFNAMEDSICLLDPEGTLLQCNAEMETLLEIPSKEFIGRKCWEVVHGMDKPIDNCPVVKMWKSKKRETSTLPIDNKWFKITADPILDENGKLTSAVHILTDITERKQKETALMESEKNYRTIFEHTGTATIILNEDLSISQVNSEFEKLSGFSRKEIEGKKKWNDFVAKEEINRLAEFSRLRIKDPNSVPSVYESKGKTRDGQIINVLVTITRIPDTRKNLVTLINITDLKKTEKALIESEKRYFLTVEAVNQGIWDWNILTGDVYFSPVYYKMLGYADGEFPASYESFRSLVHPDDIERVENKIKDHIENAGGYVIEFRLKKSDGTWCWIIGKGRVIETDEDGKAIRMVGTHTDITERKENEEAIIQAKEEWENTFDAVPDLIAILDNNYKILSCNKPMASSLGLEPEDCVGLKCYNVVHRLDAPPYFCPHSKLLEDGLEHAIEVHEDILGGDFDVSVSPLHNKSGELIGCVHVAHNITQRKKMEENLRISNEWLSFAQKASKSGFWDWDMTTEKLNWSPEFLELFGLPYDTQPSFDIWLEILHPDDRDQAMDKINHAIEEHKFLANDYRIIRPNGEELWIRALGTTYYDNSDDPLRMSGICIDITKNKKTEKALRDSEEKYRTLFETDPDYTLLIGNDGIILDVNNATTNITGLSREELIGKHFIELGMAIPEDTPTYVEKISRILKGEEIKPFESQLRDKDGKIHWGFVTLTPIIKDEKISSFIAIISDFSERKVAETQLKATLEEKELLLREIHHRVKNNMQIISSLLNLQIQHEDLDETVNVLKESQGRVKSMAMVHEKLYQSDNFSNIHLKEYLLNLIADIFYSYGVKNETINWELDVDDINIGIDTAIPLGLIVNELVTNSVKYAFPQGEGTITINLQSLPEQIKLTITDDGIGLHKNIDIENTKTLGLQLVNSLVNQIDGNIELDRSHGTEFKITFKELEYKKRM
jgi:PAS domain S-box-containing protein